MLPALTDSGLASGNPFVGHTRRHPNPTVLQVEMHQGFEVGIVQSGRMERHCEGWSCLAGPGEVWLNAAWEPHGWRVILPGTRESVFHFIPEFVEDQILEGPWYLNLFSGHPRERPRATTPQMRKEMLAITQHINRELDERRRGWRSAVQLALLRMLHTLGRDWEPHGSASPQRRVPASTFSRIMPAVNLVYTEASFTRRVSLAEAASACSLSISHFRFLFRRAMGINFGRFSLRARIAFASGLLLNTGLSIDAVAQRAGFADGSHLHRAFVKHYGSTPAQYREHGLRLPDASASAT